MTDDLIYKRMRKQRESTVEVGKFKFTILRPTREEALNWGSESLSLIDLARRYVVDWENVQEKDLVRSGSSDTVEFTPRLWEAWLPDSPDFWEPIGAAILDAVKRHAGVVDDAVKNSDAG